MKTEHLDQSPTQCEMLAKEIVGSMSEKELTEFAVRTMYVNLRDKTSLEEFKRSWAEWYGENDPLRIVDDAGVDINTGKYVGN